MVVADATRGNEADARSEAAEAASSRGEMGLLMVPAKPADP